MRPFSLPAEPDTAAAARALHARRALERAIDHGTDLLAALGLPSLVLEALEAGIDALDALDAPDADLEDEPDDEDLDSERVNEDGDALDCGEWDPSDREPSLGAPEGCQHYKPDTLGLDLEADDSDLEPEPDDHDPGDPRWWQRSAHPPTGDGAHV